MTGNAEQVVNGDDLANETQSAGRVPLEAGAVYTIRVKGQLGNRWEEWFCGWRIKVEPDGETLLCGRIVDQAALHGVLDRVQRLGLELLAVNRVESPPERNTDNNSDNR